MKWLIWILAALFYLYEYFIRVAPSVIVPELMQALNVHATAIGALSAFYFYIYAPLQIPVGMLTDRYGARLLLAFSALITGVGTLFFGLSSEYSIVALGRFLMGTGGAFGFVGVVYICSHWFEEKRRGIMIGFANTVGMLGAILGQGPLRIGIDSFGWRDTFLGLAFFGIILAIVIYLFLRNDPSKANPIQWEKQTSKELWQNLIVVCKNRQSWINGLMALFFYVTTATFAGLWGIPFIHTVYGIPIDLAGFAVSMLFVGWVIGGPLIGIYSDKIKKKKMILSLSSLIGFLLMCIVVYLIHLPLPLLFIILFLIGFVSSAELLNFSYSIDINPLSAKGTAASFTNFVVVVGSALLQPFIGYLLDLNWTGQLEENIRVYSQKAYLIAMTAFPLTFLLSFFLSLFMKNKPERAS